MGSNTRFVAMEEPVLITGASGFVASHVVNAFLSRGYKVRGTVRSEEAANKVMSHSRYSNQLSMVIVPDMAAPNAFDEAVKGVSGVIHTASPFALEVEDNDRDLLQPAIQGTLNILEAISRHKPSVRRVVITSSFASVLDPERGFRPGYTYTEDDWNPCSYEIAKTTTNGSVAYCASKAFAERSAWDWMSRHKPDFSIATICPPWIFGPSAEKMQSLTRLNESTEKLYHLIDGSLTEVPAMDFAAFVDVRDVAQAHLLSYEVNEAANQRFLVGAGYFDYQTACDIIRAKFPSLQEKTPKGTPGASKMGQTYILDGSKAERVLGLKYRSLETTLTDTVNCLLAAEKSIGN